MHNIASGRTHVLAVAFLNKAFNNIGSVVRVFDHNKSRHSRKFLINKIIQIFNNEKLNETFDLMTKDSTIYINKRLELDLK